MARIKDLTGQKFGKLVVTSVLGKNEKGNYKWLCKCDCGNNTTVDGGNLTSGNTKSCGCMRVDAIANARKNTPCKFIDLTGERFGKLIVKSRVEGIDGSSTWNCLCDCGRAVVVEGRNLRYHRGTRSCGCLSINGTNKMIKINSFQNTMICQIVSKNPHRTNITGVRGVSYRARSGMYEANICCNGKKYYLGSYADIKDAIKARQRAEDELFEPIIEEYQLQALKD